MLQLDQAKTSRGERVEDGTAQRDRRLYEILKENKDKKDAEFNERFKHIEERIRKVADEEAEQLKSFQLAVEAQTYNIVEVKETPPAPVMQEQQPVVKKKPHSRSLGMLTKVKPQAKKAKLDHESAKEPSDTAKVMLNGNVEKTSEPSRTVNVGIGLISYGDDSEDDD